MNSTLKSFLTRSLSALVAIAILFVICFQFGTPGLIGIILIGIAIANYEFTKIIFKGLTGLQYKLFFFMISYGLFLAFGYLPRIVSMMLFPLAAITLCSVTLFSFHRSKDINAMLNIIARSITGLLYISLLPAACLWIAQNPMGPEWFIFLLVVVFAGDTFAYLFGVLFGKHKIMPSVSPKKSLEGALGGLAGSAAAGGVFWYFQDSPPTGVAPYMLTAVIAGFMGQFGDFFESLLKRVAEVKDSGKIMPGHGGLLDRIDAVLFASPVVMLALYLLYL